MFHIYYFSDYISYLVLLNNYFLQRLQYNYLREPFLLPQKGVHQLGIIYGFILGRKIRNPPAGYPPDIHRISAGGRKDLIWFLTNENRAQGSKDLTKQQVLPSKYFFNNNNKNNNNSSNNLKKKLRQSLLFGKIFASLSSILIGQNPDEILPPPADIRRGDF